MAYVSVMVDRSSDFDEDISNWGVNNVKNMTSKFAQTGSFNGITSNWIVRNVKDMARMFLFASGFH